MRYHRPGSTLCRSESVVFLLSLDKIIAVRSTIKTTLLFVTLIVGCIYLAGCKKNAATIVGVWTEETQSIETDSQGMVIRDTTIKALSLSAMVVTFDANGTYSSQSLTGGIGAGTYKYTGSKLTLIDTSNSTTQVVNVTLLTNNALSIEMVDTTRLSPLVTNDITYNFAR